MAETFQDRVLQKKDRTFLGRWVNRSPSTVASIHSALNDLFRSLYVEGEMDENPMTLVARPRRPRPEDIDVVLVKLADVERMLDATKDWQAFLCLSVSPTPASGEAPRVRCDGVASI